MAAVGYVPMGWLCSMTMRVAIVIPLHAVAWLGLLSGLSGCAHYQAMPLDLQTNRQELSHRTLGDADLQQRLQALQLLPGNQPVSHWDRAQLLVIAAERNPQLLAARAQLQTATAARMTAHALPNPTVTLGTEYTLSQAAESPWLWSLSTDWLLDTGLRRQLRTGLADLSVRAARLDYAEMLWSVRSELRTALLSYLLSAQRHAVLTEMVSDQQRLRDLQRQRLTHGAAGAAEVLQVDLELARARSSLADNLQLLATARSGIAHTLGMPLSALQQQDFIWDELIHVVALDDDDLLRRRETALLSRADLEHALLAYQSRELELQQAIRQQYPQLSIGPGYTWDHGAHKVTLGLSFSLPLFNRNQGPIAEAEARRSGAGDEVMAIQAQILNEIDSAQQAYQSAVQNLQTVLQQSDAVESLLQQARQALALGGMDQIGVVTATLATRVQSLAVLDAVEVMQRSLGQLEDALRTPLSGPELALGQSALFNRQ